jgi:hypothetical protein
MSIDAPEPSDSNTSGGRESEAQYRERLAKIESEEIEKSRKLFATNEAYQAKQLQDAKKRGAAERSFAEAAAFAKQQIQSDGLVGEIRPYYEIRYTVAQGIKAAVHGREDGIAALVLQRDILLRLDGIKVLLWIAISILAFVAYKVA